MEIYRREWETENGRELTSISCKFLESGGLRIEGYDIGPSVEKLQGDFDYEYWIEIEPEDLQRLLLLILKETFNAQACLTFGRILELCRENDIESNFGNWR